MTRDLRSGHRTERSTAAHPSCVLPGFACLRSLHLVFCATFPAERCPSGLSDRLDV
jgi:hypothetical protein